VPVPRVFGALYTWGQRALYIPDTRAAAGPRTAPAAPPPPPNSRLFAAIRASMGWMHGSRPPPDLRRASPLGGAPLRYAAECALWPFFYSISPIVGAHYKN